MCHRLVNEFQRPNYFLTLGVFLTLVTHAHAETYSQPLSGTQPVAVPPSQQALGVQNYVNTPNPTTNLAATPMPDDQASAPSNKAELQIQGSYDATPTSNVNGGTNYGIDTTLYSATFGGHWRLFAGEYYTHEIEPIGEGTIGLSRSTAGAEYHKGGFTVSLAPTYNYFNETERVGGTADASWIINSHWAIGGDGQLFSRDIPLRALNAGITANSYNANTTWSPNDMRDIRIDADVMTFSDANLRSSVAGAYTEHLYSDENFGFDGLATLAESQNSEDENRPYFNPSQDVLGMIGGRLSQPLYKNHGYTYEHSFEVTEGVYWQQNYGESPAITARYQQRLKSSDSFDGGVGVSFTRQASDGEQSNDIVLLVDMTERF